MRAADTDTSVTQVAGPTVLHGLDGLREQARENLGTSGWVTVEQRDIDTFAKLTGNEQWIHVDPERAATGPFGATVQHGFLTLGRATGRRIRVHVDLADVEDLGEGGAEAVYHLTYEVEDEPKPCCVADLVFRYYPGEAAA